MEIPDDVPEVARRDARRKPQAPQAEAGMSSNGAAGFNDMYSGWWQIALPRCRPSDNTAARTLESDGLSLRVTPGSHLGPNGFEPAGLPFGAIAKLVVIYLQSEALRTGSRDVALGRNLHVFLGQLGVPIGERTAALVTEQVHRLSYCRLTLHKAHNGGTMLVNRDIMDVTAASDNGGKGGQERLLVRTVRLDGEFFRQLRQHAAPLDNAAIRQLHDSAMALDVYCWLTYRYRSLCSEKLVSWAALAGQFGQEPDSTKRFKADFTKGLALVQAVCRDARADATEANLMLGPSPNPAGVA